MPIISVFYGIVIRMYHADHSPPHFHVQYGSSRAIIEIKNGELLRGTIPKNALRLTQGWRKMHVKELLNLWQQAQQLESLKRIPPLE